VIEYTTSNSGVFYRVHCKRLGTSSVNAVLLCVQYFWVTLLAIFIPSFLSPFKNPAVQRTPTYVNERSFQYPCLEAMERLHRIFVNICSLLIVTVFRQLLLGCAFGRERCDGGVYCALFGVAIFLTLIVRYVSIFFQIFAVSSVRKSVICALMCSTAA